MCVPKMNLCFSLNERDFLKHVSLMVSVQISVSTSNHLMKNKNMLFYTLGKMLFIYLLAVCNCCREQPFLISS